MNILFVDILYSHIRLWGPASLLSNGYQTLLPGGKAAEVGVNLNTHLHLVPSSKILELYLLSPTHLHVMMLN
jgi:hypothetical protein